MANYSPPTVVVPSSQKLSDSPHVQGYGIVRGPVMETWPESSNVYSRPLRQTPTPMIKFNVSVAVSFVGKQS